MIYASGKCQKSCGFIRGGWGSKVSLFDLSKGHKITKGLHIVLKQFIFIVILIFFNMLKTEICICISVIYKDLVAFTCIHMFHVSNREHQS